jgi:hypothetical protein
MATETITVNVGGQPSLTVAVEVEQVSGTAPPDFVATLRDLSPGDDTPINTYATDLDTYVADIDEAQDLLDAGQAAGDVATAIALLSGGGGGVPEYASLQDVIAAIAATTLAEGDAWRISWTGDTYLADGEVVGTVRRGVPSWGDLLPATKLGTTASTASSAGAGARTTDGAGRLRLTVGASDTDDVLADLGLTGRPYRRMVQAINYTTATPGNASELLVQARLSSADGTAWLGHGLRYFSSWTMRLDATEGSTSPISPSPSISATAFASGARLDLEMSSGPDFASRTFAYELTRGSSVAESSSGFAQPTGLGDWRGTPEVRVRLRLSSSGTAGQADLIGLLCEV